MRGTEQDHAPALVSMLSGTKLQVLRMCEVAKEDLPRFDETKSDSRLGQNVSRYVAARLDLAAQV